MKDGLGSKEAPMRAKGKVQQRGATNEARVRFERNKGERERERKSMYS